MSRDYVNLSNTVCVINLKSTYIGLDVLLLPLTPVVFSRPGWLRVNSGESLSLKLL